MLVFFTLFNDRSVQHKKKNAQTINKYDKLYGDNDLGRPQVFFFSFSHKIIFYVTNLLTNKCQFHYEHTQNSILYRFFYVNYGQSFQKLFSVFLLFFLIFFFSSHSKLLNLNLKQTNIIQEELQAHRTTHIEQSTMNRTISPHSPNSIAQIVCLLFDFNLREYTFIDRVKSCIYKDHKKHKTNLNLNLPQLFFL